VTWELNATVKVRTLKCRRPPRSIEVETHRVQRKSPVFIPDPRVRLRNFGGKRVRLRSSRLTGPASGNDRVLCTSAKFDAPTGSQTVRSTACCCEIKVHPVATTYKHKQIRGPVRAVREQSLGIYMLVEAYDHENQPTNCLGQFVVPV
jgi:hypothetical protein